MQRTDCPVCRENEVLPYLGPRGQDWRCKHCNATPTQDAEYVILFGNQWLLADNGLSFVKWIENLGKATRHTFEWAEKFRVDQLEQNKRVDVYTLASATEYEQILGKGILKWLWMGEFEAELHQLMRDNNQPLNDYTYHIPGVGCTKYHFAIPDYMGRGMNAKEAARDFYANNPPTYRPIPAKQENV
jgi:transposase-like protein